MTENTFTPMSFKKYSSIENTYRKAEIDRIVDQGLSGGKWRVSEKIHGSNFSFWYDGSQINCAKRTAFLGEGSNFFNWQDVRMVEQPRIEKMWDYIKNHKVSSFIQADETEELVELVVYGEIFGGTYPHKDVERDYNGMTVQKGIYYTPSNMFYGFDIKINGRLVDEITKGELFKEVDMLWDEPLFEGTFEECLKYPNAFPSTLPIKFGLPEIEGNICEGVVIKPVEVKCSWAGSRIVLKNKNDKFAEKTGKQSGEKKMKQPKAPIILSESAQAMADEILLYVTENRLRNVLSKMEKITDKDFGKVVGNMNKDVMEDFLKDNRDAFMALEEKERKYIPKMVGSKVVNELVRPNFLNIIDNNF